MAKQSMIQREKKRERTVAKFAAKRAEIKAAIKNPELSDEERGNISKSCKSCRVTRVRHD